MGDWIQADPDDIMSIFTQKTRTPLHRQSFNITGVNELRFSPSPRKSLDFTDTAFCSKENVDQCIVYLNQELSNLGFSSMFHAETQTFDIVTMVNNLNDLVKLHRKTLRQKENIETRQQKSDREVSHLQQSVSHLKETIQQIEKERNSALEQQRQTSCKNNTLTNTVKAEKDEIRRLKSVIQHQERQFIHEFKKKERETNRLKERIHSLITDKNQEKRFTMEISHPLQRSDGRRGKWRTNDNKNEEEMYSMIINSYEEKVQSFMVENHQLRECLKQLQRELKSALKSNPSTPNSKDSKDSKELCDLSSSRDVDDDDDAASVASTGSDDVSEGHFQMPYDMVGEGIERSLKQKCRLLKARIRSKDKQSKDSSSENSSPEWQQHQRQPDEQRPTRELKDVEREELEQKLARYQNVIDQQETLIQSFLMSGRGESERQKSTFVDECKLVEERQDLEERIKLFAEEKSNFDHERKLFTDAAVRLGLERKEFEVERASYLKSEFLHMASTLNDTKSRNHDGASSAPHLHPSTPTASRLRPSTPSFSPAPKRMVQTPSTGELYRSLGLVSQRGQESRLRSESDPIVCRNTSRSSLPSDSTPPTPIANSTRLTHRTNYHHSANNSVSSLGNNASLLGDKASSLSNEPPFLRGSQSSPGVSILRHNEHLEHVKEAMRRRSSTDLRSTSNVNDV